MPKNLPKIFMSYASERKAQAEPIALALRSRGYEVFFDRDDLLPGQTYHDQIERTIAASDILVFGVSPESVAKGRYTLTEIKLARRRWRTPHGHVLPVMLAPTPIDDVPTYLREVSFLEPEGNLIAEVAAEVSALLVGIDKRKRYAAMRRIQRLAMVGVAVALLVAAAAVGLPVLLRTGPSQAVNAETPRSSPANTAPASLPQPADVPPLDDSEIARENPVTPKPAPAIDPRDQMAWKEASSISDFDKGIVAAQNYLARFSSGAYRHEANSRVAALRTKIKKVQSALSTLGAPVAVDGEFGSATRNRLRDLSCSHSYEWNGKLTDILIRDLESLAGEDAVPTIFHDRGSSPATGTLSVYRQLTVPAPVGPAAGSRVDFVAKAAVDRVYFDRCKNNLDSEDRIALAAQVSWLKQFSSVRVEVRGFADESEGSRDYAMSLSAARAEAVAAYLRSNGIASNRIRTFSFGMTQPMDKGDSDAARARNRHVYTIVAKD